MTEPRQDPAHWLPAARAGSGEALGRLSDVYRQVITWRYQEERSFEEIGQLLRRSPEAARKLWARAIERLQEELEALP